MSIFDNVPIDPDTRVRANKVVTMAGIPALHQQWAWEGIVAESCIFASQDVSEKSDEELQRLVSDSSLWDQASSFTVKRTAEYIFVNFNFES
ncbi:MAG: hypothetical protein ACSHXK_13980 [Oceanococcus sp.]